MNNKNKKYFFIIFSYKYLMMHKWDQSINSSFVFSVERTCGAVVSTNETYLVNEGYPSAFTGVGNCQYIIEKVSYLNFSFNLYHGTTIILITFFVN